MVSTERGDETRARILREAGRLFAEHGYLGTSMGDILEATELTKGGVYFHFRSKRELAEAVIVDADERVSAIILDHATGDRAIDRLMGMAHGAFVACCSPDMDMITELCDELGMVEGGRASHESAAERWVEQVEHLIVLALAEGDVAPDDALSPRAAAEMLMAAFFGTKDLPGDASERDRYRDAYLVMARRLLRLPEPS